MVEVWKDIAWWEWMYQISNIWNVKSLSRLIKRGGRYPFKSKERILKKIYNEHGYFTIIFCKDWRVKSFMVHRLVAQAFIPNPENKPQINHKNWIRDDNRTENLERCTNWENQLHAYKYLWKTNGLSGKKWILSKTSKKIYQYSLKLVLIRQWDCINDVERELWFAHQDIWRCCRWTYKQSHWYVRKYSLAK